MVADFTLDLRQSNSIAIEACAMSLPRIQSFRDVLQHLHQSIQVEMGDQGSESGRDSNHVAEPQETA